MVLWQKRPQHGFCGLAPGMWAMRKTSDLSSAFAGARLSGATTKIAINRSLTRIWKSEYPQRSKRRQEVQGCAGFPI